MQLLYFITTVTSQVHSARHHQRAGFSKLIWNLPWNGASPFADQTTSRMQNWREMNVWSSAVYSCDFHEGRQHFITLLMFVLNFVLFF